MKVRFLFIFLLTGVGSLFADEYDFDPDKEVKKQPYEIAGYAEILPAAGFINKRSVPYMLNYPGGTGRTVLDAYRLNGFLRSSLDLWKFTLAAAAMGKISYQPDLWNGGVSLHEGYARFSPVTFFSAWAGKKSVKWGKGYVWNPVSYAGRQKDINDVDADLEGYTGLSAETIITFPSEILKTLSLQALLIPVYEPLNQNYTEQNSTNFIGRVYFLFLDTDIDLYGFINNQERQKLGADLSRNIGTSLEIHGEFSYEWNVRRYALGPDSTLDIFENNRCHYLAGLRYLTPFNITVIFEYLHNGTGYHPEEITFLINHVEKKTSSTFNPESLAALNTIYTRYYTGQFVLRDYLYLRLNIAEPFNILYFKPYIFSALCLNDSNIVSGIELNDDRFKNIFLALKYSFLWGREKTGADLKWFAHKIELKARYFF